MKLRYIFSDPSVSIENILSALKFERRETYMEKTYSRSRDIKALSNVEESPEKLTYTIPGDPVPLARCRVMRTKTGALTFYDSQKNLKVCAGIYLQQQHDENNQFSGPVSLDVTFYVYLPQHRRKTDPRCEGYPHSYKPDLSNLLKFIEDLITDVEIWKDDCIIAHINARKIYSSNPRTVLTIEKYHE